MIPTLQDLRNAVERSYEVPNNVLQAVPRPMVTVRTVTFRHAAYIEKCIESVLMQKTTFPVEYLIGEDASTDGTRDIVLRYAAQCPDRIRVITSDTNVGMRANGYRLLMASRGKYHAICEGDDYWTDPYKLQKQVDHLEQNPQCGGTYHATRMIEADGTDTGKLMREGIAARIGPIDAMAPVAPFHTGSFVFRPVDRAMHARLMTSAPSSLDMALFVLVAHEGPLERLDGTMSVYRKHPGGITANKAYNGLDGHQSRILLWILLDTELRHRYADRTKELYRTHWKHIVQESTPRIRLRYLLGQLRACPRWILGHPAFMMARMREALAR